MNFTLTSEKNLQSGAAGYVKGFVTCFLEVPLACLGSRAAAVQPNSLGNSQKTVYKTFGTSGRPTQYTYMYLFVGEELRESRARLVAARGGFFAIPFFGLGQKSTHLSTLSRPSMIFESIFAIWTLF